MKSVIDKLRPTACACTAVRRASRAVTQLYDLVLAPTRLKATQVVILQAIAEHGEISQSALANQYAITPESLSRRLAKLRTLGFVAARPGENRAERFYCLTDAGSKILQEALPFWNRAQQRLEQALTNLGETEVRAAVRVLDLVTGAALQAACLRMSNVAGTEQHFVPPTSGTEQREQHPCRWRSFDEQNRLRVRSVSRVGSRG